MTDAAARIDPARTAAAPAPAPRFSLVMPAYNAAATLGRAIDSVLAQEYCEFELIVVDDGSADDTLAIAHGYERTDPRVRVIVQAHAGCAGARQAGAAAARGEFVTKVDADDTLTPDALAVLSAAIDEEPDYDIYSATGYKVYPDGTCREALNDPKFLRPLSLVLDDLIEDCWIFGGAASIRRTTLERVGGFRAQMRCEDYDLWLRSLAAGATHRYVPAHIYRYSMGLAGRMNEDPIPSFLSYIEILQDLSGDGTFGEREKALAEKSIARFRERIRQLEEDGTTLAEYTDAQARRFKAGVYRVFGKRAGDVVIRVADRVKRVVEPLRIALAKRARSKGRKR